jgi:2-methoxy-6-polyprenyl-1,4-benzoquinol methylase
MSTDLDKMNDAMSFGVHRLWKDTYVSGLNPRGGIKCLDVAGGTGERRSPHMARSRTNAEASMLL